MPAGFPRFRLYASNGTTLIYEFTYTTDINDFQDPAEFVEHTSLRGQGSIIVEGSDQPWDLNLSFVLIDEDYEALVAQLNALPSTIEKFTKYILKVDLTPSSTKDYYVTRLQPFSFPLNNNKKRVNFQTAQVIFRVNSW